LGDMIASAGYNVYSGDALALDLVGNVKLGTADAKKGLGTGQNDYSAQVDGYYTLDNTTLFATAGRKVYGSPSGINLSSATYGTIGAGQKLSDSTSAGLMLDVANSPSASSSNQRDVTAYISQKISSSIKVQADILKGFSDGSPDYGFGAMITGYF
jgi:isopentenyl phosphate kinase